MVIERLITESGVILPPGTSANFLSEHIIGDLMESERDQIDEDQDLLRLVAGLAKIPKGKKAAGQFHTAIQDILRTLFKGRLGTIEKETPIFSGIKRVDLKAANDQREGFFVNLREHYHLKCPYIFFECKNYAEDPNNPEFDQLLTRLNPTSTQVGYIVCRQIKDSSRALQRCKEAYLREDRKKLMLWLTDEDMIELANARAEDGLAAVDAALKPRLEQVILN